MKKAILISLAAVAITGCSSMKDIPDRKTYAQPGWYQSCAQEGVKGWFWWKEDMVYACGAGESAFAQAAEEQMDAIAMNNFAKRIDGVVNSETVIDIKDDKKSTRTVISYKVDNTAIRKHVKTEKGHFTMNGRHYTYVRLEMKKDVFEQLIAEAKATKASKVQ
jgi:V8-like Glu-specific endopeptidase